MASKPTVVIVGSGWSGFTLAQALSVAKYNINVVSPIRTVQYTPLLASAATLPPFRRFVVEFVRLAEEPIRRRNRMPGLAYYKATVENVDFGKREVHCRPFVKTIAEEALQDTHPFTLSYDKLILAPGCDIQAFGTPGALEHASFLRCTDDARKIQQRLLEMLDAASTPNLTDQQQREILRIIIVGGGPIGIEATAELYDLWFKEMRHLYAHLDGKLSLEIHDVAPTILGNFDERLGEYAVKKLVDRGIKIETESHIEKVEEGAIYTKERGKIKYGMLLWATGSAPNKLAEKLDVKKDDKLSRISTDRRLRVRDTNDRVLDGVFALGDSADIEGYSLPQLAEVAVQKAEYLAQALNSGDETLGPFEYRQKPNLAYLGQKDGVIGGREEWTGYSAWLAWRSGSIFHWPRSWRRTIMIGISWLFNKVGGRDIARKW
ncbi:uncharacterized protein MYCFIDRAFT_29791 [Pseudocercospora fijiensis CIRAD86]|uniref:FAD/NAD(P)-binding domain-containing protein n=1 Tax=Pseudocercospora fijiensis (strain CIRAD86) TaxID=383855 RepID=M2Z9Y9_PSEFD|nr:uncharacterized protein MYCFIDRAFT_29791 [Pseudocercospora fijiensis CIRAD86]EME86665.1 hypothetical protein MYCFIDRAFT_29791 [Pseudocercospora fijiensis CIRAD86]